MRTVSIPIYTSKKFEIFFEKRDEGYEFWAVGIAKGQRVVIDHHLTHYDLETRLEYAQPEDLIWRDADPSEIPAEKHKHVPDMEKTMAEGIFLDSVLAQFRARSLIDRDRKDTAAARKAMLGRWTDGVVTFSIEPPDKLRWSCSNPKHWLNLVAHHTGKPPPNYWSLNSHWVLHLMHSEHVCGTHVDVFRIDEDELHISAPLEENGKENLNRMAYVFQRDRQPNTALEPTPTAP